MNKQIMPMMHGSLSRIFDSPLCSFVDAFFADTLPMDLVEREGNFPKYNILKKTAEGENGFVIDLALAGYQKGELKVSTKDGVLTVETIRPEPKTINNDMEFLVHGIALRDFKWSCNLPKWSEISKTTYENGILSIDVNINIPEDQKPKEYIIE